MIPTDLAARLRVLMESAVHPLAAVRETPADVPNLRPGQRFSANIQAVLPDGTYRALVAGKSMTLALPQPVKTGDALELLVIEHNPKSILAAEIAAPPQPQPATAQAATLSRAAQLIGTLLARDGDAPPQATPLSRSAPLLPQAPVTGQNLAPVLQAAVAQSGLFYEAHQAQWIAGRLPLDTLLREPQAHHAPPPASPGASGSAPLATLADHPLGNAAASAVGASTAALDSAQPTANAAVLARAANELESAALATSRETPAARTAFTPALPEELAPLVRQQLDALANQHVLMLGQVWPGQTMEWEIEDAHREHAANDADDQVRPWTTSLRLVLPQLGELVANLSLDARGVGIALRAADPSSALALRDGTEDLALALAGVGVPLLSLQVDHGGVA